MATNLIEIDQKALDAITRQVAALGPDAKKASKDALLAAAKIVTEAARPKIPRSRVPRKATRKNSWRTGRHVADVLRAEVAKTTIPMAGVGVPKGLQDGPHFYLRFLEYGAKNRTHAGHYVGKAGESTAAASTAIIAAHLKRSLGL